MGINNVEIKAMKPIFIYSDRFLDAISWFMKVGGISLFPFVVLRQKYEAPTFWYEQKRAIEIHRHETIHFKQQLEMGVILFYVWYVLEWLVRLPFGNAYRNISFEREAYANEGKEYKRRMYNWIKYL